jgi:hypothetical protein
MPLMLGIPITMIDPIDWVHQPQLLFSAIRKHRGTVCYMPNFGFEVMAKAGKQKPMPAMRHWISCSEPTYPATLERFMQATDADPSQLSTCYGMAENVFAVTKSAGLRIFEHDERRYVSCGRPIAGTEIKLVDDELFVRSPHSIKAYEGGENIRDAEGYYATGDLGFLVDGEVVITGRKQDLANVGGQKYLLNDLDFALGQIFPESAGRIASIALHDAACGTEKVLFLIENDRFWEKQRSEEPAQLIREATGVEWIEVHFVPRRFITKTSSGKINRNKTLEAWQACQSFDGIGAAPKGGEVDLAKQLRDRVPGVAADRPVGEALDSLGLVMLRLFCEEHGIDYAPDLTLACIASSGQSKDETAKPRVFSIVAMVDGIRLGIRSAEPRIDEAFLDSIAKAVGMPVHLEHLCAPPIPILFSDLIFHDYFLPRNSGPEYAPFSSEIKKIKNADLLLVDDEDPFRMPCYSAYPVLDRNFETDPEAALLGHRLQRYTQNHHLLPRRVMLGREITPETINPALKSMESYLGKPIFKMAFHDTARKYTADWDFCEHLPISDEERLTNTTWVGRFQQTLLEFIGRRFTRADSYRPGENRSILHQHPHFCSILMNRAAVDFITDRYQSFCIIGLPSSLPYLQHRLEALGKPYVHTLQADNMHRDFDCIVITGGNGNISSTCKPVFDFMHAQRGGGRPNNVSRELEQLCPSLAACNQQLYRRARDQYGTDSPLLIGNYLLNQSIALVLPSLALQEQIAVPLALGS